jgi:hypothetical protein
MIVHNLNLMGAPVVPSETDAPLVVDPDAHLPFTVAFENLKPVSWRISEILDGQRRIQLPQLPKRPVLDIGRQFPARIAQPNALGLLATERLDHR